MVRTVEMLRRVLILRLIAAPDVPARHAESQMNPGVPRFQAILTSVCARRNVLDLIEVCASNSHVSVSLF
jgi:hypothetical protein